MSVETLNPQGDAVAWAEANMCIIAMVRFCTLRRHPYNYKAIEERACGSNISPPTVCGPNVYVVCRSDQKGVRQKTHRQSDGCIVPMNP